MPASNIDLYYMQDTRKKFDAMRPAPVCADADVNQYRGQYQNIHISTNCYYGYHDRNPKPVENPQATTDCEMLEVSPANGMASPQPCSRKRSADDSDCPLNKRFKEEVQSQKNIEPETNEIKNMDKNTEDFLLETLYWNIHGGNMFQLLQCQ